MANMIEIVNAISENDINFFSTVNPQDIISNLNKVFIHETDQEIFQVTLLLMASLRGHDKIVEFLINLGANIDQKNNRGETSLYLAASTGKKSTVTLLLKNGALINQQNNAGATALHVACKYGFYATVKILLRYGANVNAVQKRYGTTPLLLATEYNHIQTAKILLKHGALVNIAFYKDLCTPLHMTCYWSDIKMAKLLIKNGAHINATNKECDTPLMIAASEDNMDMVALLIDHNANVNIANRDNETPLLHIARSGDLKLIKRIIDKKADLFHSDIDGFTAILGACIEGHIDVVKYFVERGAKYITDNYNGIYLAHANQNYLVRDYLIALTVRNSKDPIETTLLLKYIPSNVLFNCDEKMAKADLAAQNIIKGMFQKLPLNVLHNILVQEYAEYAMPLPQFEALAESMLEINLFQKKIQYTPNFDGTHFKTSGGKSVEQNEPYLKRNSYLTTLTLRH